MNTNTFEKFQKRLKVTYEKHEKLTKMLEKHGEEIKPGDIYIYKNVGKLNSDVCVEWLCLHEHPKDKNLVFMVPVDTRTGLIGVNDVKVPDIALSGPQVLRLGRSVWLLKSHIKKEFDLVGLLEDLFIRRAQFIMSRIAKFEWVGSDAQQQTEFDPDYDEWIDEFIEPHYNQVIESRNIFCSQL